MGEDDEIDISVDEVSGTMEVNGVEQSPAKGSTQGQSVLKEDSRSPQTQVHNEKHKLVRLPLARIKNMMKLDPDCQLISQEAVLLVTKATEMFVESLSKEAYKMTAASKRKTVMKRDIDVAIDNVPHFCFLDGALE